MAKRIKEEDKNSIIEQYLEGKNTSELGRLYNVNPGAIYYLIKKNGITPRNGSQAGRKYDIKEDFFDVIDTKEKAYFLGILYADGCNSTENNLVRIVLTAKDKPLLERLSSEIYNCHRPLSLRKGKWFEDNGKRYKRKDSYCLSISNKHISKKLNEYGLVKAKSLKVTFPEYIPDELTSHFIRGYFDGDGSISFSSNQISISILGTESFCETLKETLHLKSIKCSVCHAKKGSELKQLIIHGNRAGMNFLNFIYKDSSIKMDRKYNKFIKISSQF